MWLQNLWNSILSIFATKPWIVSDKEYASMPTLFHFDDYDNCMLYGKDALYCGIFFQLSPKNPQNVSKVWEVMQKVSSLTDNELYKHDSLKHGICVTTRCPGIPKSEILNKSETYIRKLSDCYSTYYENLDLKGKIDYIYCVTNQSSYSVNTYDFLFGAFVIILISLVLYATLYDLIFKPNFKNEKVVKTVFGKYTFAFSLLQNWKRLVEVDYKDPDTKKLSCIQGVRLYNVAVVIVIHTLFEIAILPSVNPRYTEAITIRKYQEFYARGTSFVTLQVFFMLSSWLLTNTFCEDIEGKNKVPFTYVIRKLIARLLRLTPLMAVTVFFVATWMPHLSEGPLWDLFIGSEHTTCRRNWWITLLYLNNFAPVDDICASHMWSLSVDIQFYIIGLLLLWFVANNPKRAFWAIGSVYVWHLIGTICLLHQYPVFTKVNQENSYNRITGNVIRNGFIIYKSSITNIPGHLAGILFGYAFYKYKNQRLFTKKVHVILWWIVSLSCIISTTTLPGIVINLVGRNHGLIIVLMLMSRTVFIFGVGLFIFGMTQGAGGIIRDVCEWPPIYVLGRLTYGAYLTHVYFQRFKTGTMRTPILLSEFTLIFDCLGFIAISFLTSGFLTLFIELPFDELRKYMSMKSKISKSEFTLKKET